MQKPRVHPGLAAKIVDEMVELGDSSTKRAQNVDEMGEIDGSSTKMAKYVDEIGKIGEVIPEMG